MTNRTCGVDLIEEPDSVVQKRIDHNFGTCMSQLACVCIMTNRTCGVDGVADSDVEKRAQKPFACMSQLACVAS